MEAELEALFLRKYSRSERVLNGIIFFLMLMLIFLLIFLNLFPLSEVDGSSMNNTLVDEQYVLLLNTKNAKAGEIVVFKVFDPRDKQEKLLIKRVIATQGQVFAFVSDENTLPEDRKVYLYFKHGDTFYLKQEDYIAEPMEYQSFNQTKFYINLIDISNETPAQTLSDENICDFKVPQKSFLMMGDNRNHSDDSRYYGFINKKAIQGRNGYAIKQDSFLEKFLVALYPKSKT